MLFITDTKSYLTNLIFLTIINIAQNVLVHEDEGADLGNGHHKTSSVPRALKPRKLDDFTCPLAVFEPPDPSKRPMYCKNKVKNPLEENWFIG